MRTILFVASLTLAVALSAVVSQPAHAQAFGSRTLGGGISSPTGNSGAFGNNSTTGAFNNNSGSLNSMGGMGSSGMGGMGGTGNGMPGISSGGMSGNLGNAGQLGQNSYARSRAGQFVGADRSDAGANPLSQANGMNQ